MKGIKLNNGEVIPLIGLGNLSSNNIEDIVYYSIKDGVRLIDTDSYLDNEKEIGNAIRKAILQKLVRRDELFIIGKLWIKNKKNPEKALKETLQKLKLEYIDLYLDQWPSFSSSDDKNNEKMISIYELWPKMENLVEKKLTKSIGVCNYNIQALNNLLSFCKINPVVNGFEFHPFNYPKNLKKFCDINKIVILAYSPLSNGLLKEFLFEDKNEELNNQIKKIDNYLVNKYEKTLGQIFLKWHIQLGTIPIVSTSKINRMEENLEALEFDLNEKDIEELCNIRNKKNPIKINDSHELFGYNIFA